MLTDAYVKNGQNFIQLLELNLAVNEMLTDAYGNKGQDFIQLFK
jgi:hypothetical protein